GKPFTVTTPPAIAAVTPSAGVSGQIVVITGVNFGATQGGLTFNGAGTDILSWSTTRVEARVPLGLPLSVVSLVLTANGEQDSEPFTVVAEQVSYYHTDALGSVRLMTDGGGQVMATNDYLPFGQDWQPTGPVDPRGFAGMERTPDTGAGGGS